MDIRELTIEHREGLGKGNAKRLRHAGKTQLLKLSFAGAQDSKMAILRDMQFDPVSENLIHVDLQVVAMDKPIQVTVALRHVGEPIGVRDTQDILEMVLREIQVSSLPGDIPEDIKADVSNLAIGDVLTVGDLQVPEGVRVLTDRAQAVATVAPPAAEEVAAPVVAAAGVVAAAPAEPEVLTERKPKEEAEADDKKGKK